MYIFVLSIPFLLQAILIIFDEWVFHIQRGLPKWERIGHPLDTLSWIICLSYVLWVPYSMKALVVYILLGVLSCLFITKDEFIHKHHCPASEQWVHAVMFINHPILLCASALFWYAPNSYDPQSIFHRLQSPLTSPFLWAQLAFACLFCLYQIIYWNILWKEKKAQ